MTTISHRLFYHYNFAMNF